MKHQLRSLPNFFRSPSIVFLMVVLILGIYFRFTNLNLKIYWFDESVTSLRLSGYSEEEVIQEVFSKGVTNSEELQKYQRLNPEKTWIDTLHGLKQEPQHVPLYFLLLRLWCQLFGDSILATRSFSAVISLLVFPCIYWLCLELFGSPLIGGMAIALAAISPVFVLFSQEARPYILWAVTTLLSSIVFLRAIKSSNYLNWAVYTLCLSISFYTHFLSLLVTVGQGIYLVATERSHLRRNFLGYLTAFFVALLTFAPWIFVAINYSQNIKSNLSQLAKIFIPWWLLVLSLLIDTTRVFIDFPNQLLWKIIRGSIDFPSIIIGLFAILSITILVVWSIYFLYRNTPLKVWLFVLILIFSVPLPLMLADLILGGVRSTNTRYLIPSFLGILIVTAYFLGSKIYLSLPSAKIWKIVTVVLISSGILSCTISSQSTIWWNKYSSLDYVLIGQRVNQTENPLLILDFHYTEALYNWNQRWKIWNLLTMSHTLDKKVKIKLLDVSQMTTLPNFSEDFSEVFISFPVIDTLKLSEEKVNIPKMLANKTGQENPKIELVFDGTKIKSWESISLVWKIK